MVKRHSPKVPKFRSPKVRKSEVHKYQRALRLVAKKIRPAIPIQEFECVIVNHEGDNAHSFNPDFHLSLRADLFPAGIQTTALRWSQLLRERETDCPHREKRFQGPFMAHREIQDLRMNCTEK